ncbi:MAG: AMP-binding protein [Thermodesulfobacteriota bacterium]|nr:AMP-binding protein [Thermodesulfobacteriota bacterium]
MKPFSQNIIANRIQCHAIHNPEGEIAVYGDRRIIWRELCVRVYKLANMLISEGVSPGDKVAFMFHNCPEFIEVNYAVQVAGAIPVPVNYRFSASEITYQINHCDARIFFFESAFNPAVEQAAHDLSGIGKFICKGDTLVAEAVAYETFLSSGSADDPQIPTDWSDVAVMIYTGGTTGFPKGVMLTYQGHLDMFCNLVAAIATRLADVNLSKDQMQHITHLVSVPGLGFLSGLINTKLGKKILRSKKTYKSVEKAIRYLFMHPESAGKIHKTTLRFMTPSMPYFHDASYQALMLCAFAGNICPVMIPGITFNPEAILKAVEAERPLVMANVPTGWKKLVSFEGFDNYDVSSLLAAATGAGVCPADLKQKIFDRFPGVVVIDVFGQTEMTPITTFRIDTSPETIKERSVGKSILDARVVDEKGKDVRQGDVGEIMYRSSWVMQGYYKDEEETEASLKDGWFKSGDLGYIDKDGEIRLVDRKKECINTGGEKVFPLEVEEVLHHHPHVEEVCVIGVPDEEWGHAIRAVVQPVSGADPDPEEIRAFCRGKLAGYKIPRSVVFVDELPLSPVGKVLRSKIRELYGQPATKMT